MEKLSNNSLALIALCNEYCALAENANQYSREDFTKSMLKTLTRIYISSLDIEGESDDFSIDNLLDEDKYNYVRESIQSLYGEHDIYLEVFEEDMKYSETPIAESISEGLADLFQVFYNFVESVKESPVEMIAETIDALKADFKNYWAQKLCNLLRPLNNILFAVNEEY